jgi:hypothetical protein
MLLTFLNDMRISLLREIRKKKVLTGGEQLTYGPGIFPVKRMFEARGIVETELHNGISEMRLTKKGEKLLDLVEEAEKLLEAN